MFIPCLIVSSVLSLLATLLVADTMYLYTFIIVLLPTLMASLLSANSYKLIRSL